MEVVGTAHTSDNIKMDLRDRMDWIHPEPVGGSSELGKES
jgi:hypothetical protein